jgi:N-acetylglutamate synthase-like GNAT family acetyltransferase
MEVLLVAALLDVQEIGGADSALHRALTEGELPTADLEDPGRRFFRIEADGRLVGYGGLEIYGEDALLRSIVVPAALQGQGHGRTVVDAVLDRAARSGVRTAWLFTSSAVDFFRHLGFAVTPRPEAPASILATRQATRICATASMLSRAIRR